MEKSGTEKIGAQAAGAETIGTHCLLELHGCPTALLDNLDFVLESLREAVSISGASLLKVVSNRFSPQGVTALGLLSESHISIHTWPEHGYLAADIFTCGTSADPRKACLFLADAFRAGTRHLKTLHRGQQAPAVSAAPPLAKQPSKEGRPCQVPNYAQTSG